DSTPTAAAKCGSRLLAAVRSRSSAAAHQVFRALEELVSSQPAALPALVPAMADLLAAEEETDLLWQVAWFLRKLRVERGFDLAAVSERFLGLLHSPSASDRRAAAYVLGLLSDRGAKHCEPSTSSNGTTVFSAPWSWQQLERALAIRERILGPV
ncbi:MAG: hypothetical protein V3T72_05200, partial [Thermoanaerobaculia bacterium]